MEHGNIQFCDGLNPERKYTPKQSIEHFETLAVFNIHVHFYTVTGSGLPGHVSGFDWQGF